MRQRLLLLLFVPLLAMNAWAKDEILLDTVVNNKPVKVKKVHVNPLRDTLRHEFRIGWGDCSMDTKLYFHDSPKGHNAQTYNYRWTGHIMAEYQYRVNNWFSIGGQVDYDQFFWKVRTDGDNAPDHNCVNIAIMPTARFYYYRGEWVNMYGDFYMGLNINTGTERNFRGSKTDVGASIGGAIFGIEVGRDRWFGGAEMGCLCALKDLNTIYTMFTRSILINVGYRF